MLLLGPDRPCHFVIVKRRGVCPHFAHAARLASQPEVDDSRVFTCGSTLFSPLSDLKSLVVRQNIQCTSPVEAQYYSAKLVNFPPVCYYCGGSKETLINDEEMTELKQQYAVVRPMFFM